MNLVDQAFLRWQRIHQPRRFRESLAGASEQLLCALAPHERRGEATEPAGEAHPATDRSSAPAPQ